MITRFSNKRIASILGVLPENDSLFDDEVDNYSFPAKQTMRLKKVMGFEKHSLSKPGTTVSDLALYGINHMLDNNWIKKDDIGAVIVVSLCPDHFVPHISNIIHGELGLSSDVFCMDIPQGCCGYLMGLFQSFMLIDHMTDKKVLLVNGDVLSHIVSHRDRNDFPLIGDAATITVVERSEEENDIYFELNSDGTQREALIVPAGGFRMPANDETSEMKDQGDGNYRSLNNLHMDGTAIFNFVQTKVPEMIKSALARNALSVDDIDYYFFHQPNRFMLIKLAERIGIPEDKIPVNLVENYGNPSGCSIPLVMALNASEALMRDTYRCCLSAFGSGLAWGSMIMKIGRLNNIAIIRSNL